MIQRRTQTETYWKDSFEATAKDTSRIYDLILDEGVPVPMEALVHDVVEFHCRQEEERIRAELTRGSVFQPKDEYEVGEDLIFPALNYRLGKVVTTRPGRSPEYGEFTVIQVEIEGEDGILEFASALQGEHKLNFDSEETVPFGAEDLLPASELAERYGDYVGEELSVALEDRDEFVQFGDRWFLKDLMVDVSEGHLHIAEALIEIKGRPLSTAELVPDLDLPAEAPEEIKVLSVAGALVADDRFDNVGDSGRDIWYLRRLTPEAVVNPPARLKIKTQSYDRDDIDQGLLLIEREIDDEGSGEEIMGASRPVYRTTISLTYPHWRAGTLPLTVRTKGLFPEPTVDHFPIILVDGRSGTKMQGWVVAERQFVYGLRDWYRRHRLPVGALLKLERTRDPRVLNVDFEPRRLKSLWTPVATVANGKLVFEMRKAAIACEYDDKLTIGEDLPRMIDSLWHDVEMSGESLFQTMRRIMPELIKLSPQGTVHAKTIYSAVNVLRRTSPGPIFALLSKEPCFVTMSGGYWTFDEAML